MDVGHVELGERWQLVGHLAEACVGDFSLGQIDPFGIGKIRLVPINFLAVNRWQHLLHRKLRDRSYQAGMQPTRPHLPPRALLWAGICKPVGLSCP